MSLSPEWRRRIDVWRSELERHLYQPLGEVSLHGVTTQERWTSEAALTRALHPMPPGTPWGGKWEYGWFSGTVDLPPAAQGNVIVLRLDTGAESAVFVGGRLVGAIDRQHRQVVLVEKGEEGQSFPILAEAYAGHGPMVHNIGPLPPGGVTVPEPPPTQRVVGKSTFGIWREDVYQLHMDVETLASLRDALDSDSLRVREIDAALRAFTLAVDFEAPLDDFLGSVREGRARLAPVLACVNGSTAPLYTMVGHAHIDTAWLWPLAETERKCARTLSTQVNLMERYPEYRFLFSQPLQYRMIRERHPELYGRIRKAVEDGQVIPEGAMWVEADTLVPGGESLVRQLLHGTRFFREEFGVDCEVLWLPDAFGYSPVLPQLLLGFGIRYFYSAKIHWAYNGSDPFPYHTFRWVGLDGSEVLTHFGVDYNMTTDPGTLVKRWHERADKEWVTARLMPFGWGDGGGGPTRDHLEYLRRLRNLEGSPRARIAHPREFFLDEARRSEPAPQYTGELYFPAHRGTYTSQARTKRGNRMSELALREAEIWGAAAAALTSFDYPLARMDAMWKQLLTQQFHDVLPGTSIRRVHAEAEEAHRSVCAGAEALAQAATGRLVAGDGESLTVFNPVGWPRTVLCELPSSWEGATGPDQRPWPVQPAGTCKLAEVEVPAMGWTTLRRSERVWGGAGVLRVSCALLENELLRVEFNERGEVVSLLDKETGRDLASGPCNALRLYRDVPSRWDAWDLDSMYEAAPVPLDEPASVEVAEDGPLRVAIRIRRPILQSCLTQTISLRRGCRRIEFDTTVEWREQHKLLKVAFPCALHSEEAIHGVQFGHVRRPTHRSRPFDADRFEVWAHQWSALAEENQGVALLNDSKYGLSAHRGTLSLSLLRAPVAPDMEADQGLHSFRYGVYVWRGCFGDAGLAREAFDLNAPVRTVPGAGGVRSLFSVDAPNVLLETVKPAEDGSGDLVLRLYESVRMATRCRLRCTLPVLEVFEANLREEARVPLAWEAQSVAVAFRAFEIKTLRLRLDRRPALTQP